MCGYFITMTSHPRHGVFNRGHTSRLSISSLQWRHSGRDGVSNHQPHDCLLNRLFRGRSKKTSKLRVTGLCAGNSPRTECQLRGKCFHLMTSSCYFGWQQSNLTPKICVIFKARSGEQPRKVYFPALLVSSSCKRPVIRIARLCHDVITFELQSKI